MKKTRRVVGAGIVAAVSALTIGGLSALAAPAAFADTPPYPGCQGWGGPTDDSVKGFLDQIVTDDQGHWYCDHS